LTQKSTTVYMVNVFQMYGLYLVDGQ